jgi:hypothetical protein
MAQCGKVVDYLVKVENEIKSESHLSFSISNESALSVPCYPNNNSTEVGAFFIPLHCPRSTEPVSDKTQIGTETG